MNLRNLLPRDADWTKELKYDEGNEPIFHFDGSTGVVVPNYLVSVGRHDFSLHPFSIVTIFRHGSQNKIQDKHVKEHIICSADDHKMNRHHMAVFVRNCRLILLLRKNYNDGDLNIFSPAEWRWKIPQVCDNEWHHYVLNVDQSSKVELFIDGVMFENNAENHHTNPEVIDDWPLHAAHGVNTTLAVGACYQGSENRLKHGFNGDISEVKVALNNILSPEDIKCGTSCAEHLISSNEVQQELDEVQVNSQMNEIYIEAQSKLQIERLMRNIQYINIKKNPTIGRRNIEVHTTLICSNQTTIRLPSIETYIMVNAPISGISDSNIITTKSNIDKDVESAAMYKMEEPVVQDMELDSKLHSESPKIVISGISKSIKPRNILCESPNKTCVLLCIAIIYKQTFDQILVLCSTAVFNIRSY